ncbi:MAG: ABC transporter substrate binding protein [Methyloglobulus sp.]|nr:hypothetical protein [Methyloglobulus sp.]
MQFNLSIAKQLIAAFIIICVGSSPLHAEKAVRVLVIGNSVDEPYQKAVAGFKSQFSGPTKPEFIDLTLRESSSSDAKKIKAINPDLIYALGNETTEWAMQQTSSIPIVSTLVVNNDIFKQSANITGVRLDFSLKTQFQWLKKFFTPPKNVAILYNPAENAAAIQTAQIISQQEGFKLVPIIVQTPKELPYALERLDTDIDVLLAIPDEMTMSVNTAKEVLLASFSNKVPLIGLSDNWVKSGALYALSWDYEDLGKQCADIAKKIASGASVRSISAEHPRKVTYTINTKIANDMDMEISSSVLKNAKMVFD